MSDQVIAIIFFVAIIALTLGITGWASRQNTDTEQPVRGWRSDQGLAERPRYLRRLSIGGLVPWHRGGHSPYRLLGLLPLHRLPGGLPGGAAAGGRAPEEPGQVHPCGHARQPVQREQRPLGVGPEHHNDKHVLHDRAAQRLGGAHRALARAALLVLGHRHRDLDDRVRRGGRHGRDDLDPDHQGPAPDRRYPDPLHPRAGPLWVQPARAVRGGRERDRARGPGSAAAKRARPPGST